MKKKTATIKYRCGHTSVVEVDLRNNNDSWMYKETQKEGFYDPGDVCPHCSRDLVAKVVEQLTPERALRVLQTAVEAYRGGWYSISEDARDTVVGVAYIAAYLAKIGLLPEEGALQEFCKQREIEAPPWWGLTRAQVDEKIRERDREEFKKYAV